MKIFPAVFDYQTAIVYHRFCPRIPIKPPKGHVAEAAAEAAKVFGVKDDQMRTLWIGDINLNHVKLLIIDVIND